MIKLLHTASRLGALVALAVMAIAPLSALAGEGAKPPFKLEGKAEYIPGRLVVKMKPGMDISAIRIFTDQLTLSAPKRMFPRHTSPSPEQTAKGFIDLSNIYEVDYKSGMGIAAAVNLIQNLGSVEYVCPKYIYQHCLTPNDPLVPQQTHLSVIGAFQAWDVFQGDSTITVGIVDSGVDWDHPDLIGNLQYNRLDPIDGVDNDNDGYTDNYRGWDLGGADYNNIVEDNQPDITGENNSHGTHVAGIAAAHTNNRVGVAGIAFGCRYLPIKCAADNDTRAFGSGYILAGYEGITYAADHGCQVINCSWGGQGQSPLGADIIRYAMVNRNSLVVCAAGNNNMASDGFYPASYPGVLSVAALNDNDIRAGFSNFGNLVGIAAPGVDVYATYYTNGNGHTYARLSGTSMASPVIAGAAALIRAKYPNLTPQQVTTILQASSQDVSTSNSGFVGQLGSGRLDLLNAVNFQGPGVRLARLNITDGNNNFFQGRDTLRMSGLFRNMLFPSTSRLRVKLRLLNQGARIVAGTDTVALGYLGTLDSINTATDPFVVALNATLPIDLTLKFKLEYTDSASAWSEFFTVLVNPSFANFTWNNISSTISSTGRIGYANADQGNGQGIRYKGSESVLYASGLMMGANPNNISNSVFSTGGSTDNHFSRRSSPLPIPASAALQPLDYRGSFADANNSTPYGMLTKYDLLGFGGPADTNYFVEVMTIRNTSTTPQPAFYVGYYNDCDVSAGGLQDRCNYDSTRGMGYIFQNTPGGLYVGVSVISQFGTNFFPIENGATATDSIGIYDGFTDAEKFRSLSSGIGAPNAGYGNTPGQDVSFTIGAGPFSLNPGDSVKLAFAFMVGKDLASLQAAADQARLNTIDMVTANRPNLARVGGITLVPNPTHGRLTIQAREAIKSVSILDPAGKVIQMIVTDGRSNKVQAQVSNLNPGMYVVQVRTAAGIGTQKLIKE